MELKLDHNIQVQIPRLDLQHLKNLTTSVGIIQHAKYGFADFHHGYSIDDNARALMLCNLIQKIDPSQDLHPLINTYISYIYYMQRDNGCFGNFLSFKHEFLDENGTEDSFGRTIWALGSVLKNTAQQGLIEMSLFMLLKAIPQINQLKSIKAVAYTLLGLIHIANSPYANRINIQDHILSLSEFLINEYQQAKTMNWKWFEPILCYDNGIVPYSLFLAHQQIESTTQDYLKQPHQTFIKQLLDVAIESTLFLDNILFDTEKLNLIGNHLWYINGQKRCYNGQQVVDIPGLILCYAALEKHHPTYAKLKRRTTCLAWLLGDNHLGKSLWDAQTKGCFDGLEEKEVNLNQGAESIISFWQAYVYYFHHID